MEFLDISLTGLLLDIGGYLSEQGVQLMQGMGYESFRCHRGQFTKVGWNDRCDLLLAQRHLKGPARHLVHG